VIYPRFFLQLSLLTLAASADALAASTQLDTDVARATLVPAENATVAVSGNASRNQLLDAAGRAVTSHAAELGVAIGQPLQAASVQTSQLGSSVVTYKQTVGNYEVLGARITTVLDASGTVHALTGGFSPNVKSASTTAFKLSPQSALQSVLNASTPKALEQRNGYSYFSVNSSSFRALRPARLKPVYFPADGRLIAAYYIEVFGWRPDQAHAEGWGSVVSAEDGSILRRTKLTHDASHSYRVFSETNRVPLENAYGDTTPHPTATPDGFLPAAPAPMQFITLDHAGISTGDPWLPAGATHTVGNNVDAFFNSRATLDGLWDILGDGPVLNPAEGDFRASLSSPATFDYPYDVTATSTDYLQIPFRPVTPIPTTSPQLNAKIVQAFYAGNWLHDLFYDLGYDEASGNAQQDNYGRGGLAGDPLVVNPAFNGTFTFAPADGESSQIYLGPNNFSGTLRDPSGFDFSTIAHEWTHTMYERLAVAGPSLQNQALNEGTADFVAMLLSVREPDRNAAPNSMLFSGAYPVGAYFNLDYDLPWDTLPAAGSAGFPDNTFYHGIRRFPYSADMRINPLTLRHIGYSNPLPATTSPPFDWKFRSLANPQIHTAGEVWASALWQCARNILADETRSTFEARKRRILAHLVTGLKMFPTDADYIEARNAVLFAMRATDAADYELCRRGFVKRGFGAGALAPKRGDDSNDSVKESFSHSDVALAFVNWQLTEAGGGDGDGVLDVGENGQLAVTLKNTGLAPLTRTRIQVPALPGVYVFPSGSSATGITLQPNEEYTARFNVRIVTSRGAPKLLFNLLARDEQRADAYARQDAFFTVNYDLRRDRQTDLLTSEQSFEADWTVGFELEHGCPVLCEVDVTNWQRTKHRGRFAYRIGSDRIGLDGLLTTVPFTVSSELPLRIVLTHDFNLTRTSLFGLPPEGVIEVSVDGGPWESVATRLVSGSAAFSGDSGGWQTDTINLGTSLSGRSVQLRWRLTSGEGFDPQPIHWALSRIEIQGAATPVFSSMYNDVE
jgi:Fungalysin metallopeptidase (M36)/Fungalysin/Thermolysin Propeptide Motif